MVSWRTCTNRSLAYSRHGDDNLSDPFCRRPATQHAGRREGAVAPMAGVAAGIRRAVASLDRTVPREPSAEHGADRFGLGGQAAIHDAAPLRVRCRRAAARRDRDIRCDQLFRCAAKQEKLASEWRLARRQVRSVDALCLRRGAVLAVTGAVVGLILSLATTRTIASLLYGVKTFDPATFVIAPVLTGSRSAARELHPGATRRVGRSRDGAQCGVGA